MRYSLTLPLALAALAVAPAIAQDVAPTPEEQAAPPANTAAPLPVDPALPAAVETTVPPTPAEMVEEAADPATPPPADPVATPESVTPPGPVATPMPTAPAPALTAEQQLAYDGWSEETKTYFDGLTSARQALFLRIADPDKAKLVALDAAQQETVWASLEKQDSEQKSDSAKEPDGS